MRINIDVTREEYEALFNIAKFNDTTVNKILSQLIVDLACSDRSDGSDERIYSDDWFSLSVYNLA